jgi:hypothetical protein
MKNIKAFENWESDEHKSRKLSIEDIEEYFYVYTDDKTLSEVVSLIRQGIGINTKTG